MTMDDVVEIKVPDSDSQWRLLHCKCKSDNVAYVLGADGMWRVRCFDCGHTGAGAKVRHEAQVNWNREVKYEKENQEATGIA